MTGLLRWAAAGLAAWFAAGVAVGVAYSRVIRRADDDLADVWAHAGTDPLPLERGESP